MVLSKRKVVFYVFFGDGELSVLPRPFLLLLLVLRKEPALFPSWNNVVWHSCGGSYGIYIFCL